MMWRILRRGFVPILLILGALLYWKLHPGSPKAISVGFVADRDVILWNTLAQVREEVAEVHYGDRVEVVRVEGPAMQVRTSAGTIGWMRDSRQLMDSELWGKSGALLERAHTLPVQALGRTKTVSNLRVEPGRDAPRIFQLGRGTRLLVLKRAVADASPAPEENSPEEKSAATDDQKSKQEDWLLVLRAVDSPAGEDAGASSNDRPVQVKRATGDVVSGGPVLAQTGLGAASAPAGPVAGWVLARFVELDLPGPVKDLASSADLHVVAWFELNRVPDGSGGEAPQYLVAGSHGGEGQVCDFTMLRVYTWGTKRKRYETAYVESDLCGRLPIQVSNGGKDPKFQFSNLDDSNVERKYEMFQTSVRRVKDPSSHPPHPRN